VDKGVGYCRKCALEKTKEWQKKNPHKTLEYARKHHYGVTPEQVRQKARDQAYQCPICRTIFPFEELVVDHCHSSGKFRAMLCKNCNTGIGFLKDRERCRRAMEYHDEHRTDIAEACALTKPPAS
jgi:hypothetical protein